MHCKKRHIGMTFFLEVCFCFVLCVLDSGLFCSVSENFTACFIDLDNYKANCCDFWIKNFFLFYIFFNQQASARSRSRTNIAQEGEAEASSQESIQELMPEEVLVISLGSGPLTVPGMMSENEVMWLELMRSFAGRWWWWCDKFWVILFPVIEASKFFFHSCHAFYSSYANCQYYIT